MSNLDARSFLEAVSGFANQQPGGSKPSSDRPVRLATVDPYFTSGLPSVVFDGETTATIKGYSWVAGYTPRAGDRVFMLPIGQSYIIGGKVESALTYNHQYRLTYQNSWQDFDPAWAPLRVMKTPSGVVHLSGMIRNFSAISLGQTITVLPEPFRPMTSYFFTGLCDGRAFGMSVLPDGRITVGTGATSGGAYHTLDNVSYPTDPTLVWNAPTFQNNWSSFTLYGPAAEYTKDSMGRVWFRGQVTHTDPAPVEAPILSVEPGFRSYRQHHFMGTGTNGMTYLDAEANGNIRFKTNGGNPSQVSLSQIMYHHYDYPGQWAPIPLQNGWVHNDVGQPEPSYHKDSEGIVYLRGLVRSGTMGLTLGMLPEGCRPGKLTLQAVNSGNGVGRLDIEPSGKLNPINGTNAWFSLDGVQFSGEQ